MPHEDQDRLDDWPKDAWPREEDGLDHELNAALAKYSTVEPRAGLEGRILANLQSECARVPRPAWWRWSLAGAVAAIVLAALVLGLRPGKPAHPAIATQDPTTTQAPRKPATQDMSNVASNTVQPRATDAARRVSAHRSHPAVLASAPPKLDQFPSPQPPSPEELALRKYVSEFPQEATLIARAQEEYEEEILHKMQDASFETNGPDSNRKER